MISADVKARKTTRNKRSTDCILQFFLKVPSNLETQRKKILVSLVSILILSVRNRGVIFFFLLKT